MTTAHRLHPIPDPHNDPAFTLFLAAFADLPRPQRNALIGLLGRWLDTSKLRRACFAKIMWPELTDEEVAVLVGMSTRHMLRFDSYRRCKPTLEDFKLSRPRSDNTKRRRGFSNPGDPFA